MYRFIFILFSYTVKGSIFYIIVHSVYSNINSNEKGFMQNFIVIDSQSPYHHFAGKCLSFSIELVDISFSILPTLSTRSFSTFLFVWSNQKQLLYFGTWSSTTRAWPKIKELSDDHIEARRIRVSTIQSCI